MSAEFHIGILAILSVMALIAGVNMFSVRSIRRGQKAQTTPMVSVLVPARNEESNIGRYIATLDDQDYPNYEVLLVDNGSTDGSVESVRKEFGKNVNLKTRLIIVLSNRRILLMLYFY